MASTGLISKLRWIIPAAAFLGFLGLAVLWWAESSRGQLPVLGTVPQFEMTTQDGKPFELTCGESSFTPEDRKLCGFEGSISTVQFVQPDGRERKYLARYQKGQLLEEETVDDQGRPMVRRHVGDRVDVTRRFENGKPYRTYSTVKGDYDGDFKEWNKDGQLVEESRYAKGRVTSRTRYYLNGKPKQELTVDPKTGAITAKDFYDTGTPKKTGTYQPCRNDRCLEYPTPDGTVTSISTASRRGRGGPRAGGRGPRTRCRRTGHRGRLRQPALAHRSETPLRAGKRTRLSSTPLLGALVAALSRRAARPQQDDRSHLPHAAGALRRGLSRPAVARGHPAQVA